MGFACACKEESATNLNAEAIATAHCRASSSARDTRGEGRRVRLAPRASHDGASAARVDEESRGARSGEEEDGARDGGQRRSGRREGGPAEGGRGGSGGSGWQRVWPCRIVHVTHVYRAVPCTTRKLAMEPDQTPPPLNPEPPMLNAVAGVPMVVGDASCERSAPLMKIKTSDPDPARAIAM